MMINAAFIQSLLEAELIRWDMFLVDVLVRPGNKITVYLDSIKGVTLNECIAVSKFLEGKLDRDKEDFELEVSSPGLDRPLKLAIQYEKNVGRIIDVVKADGNKVMGTLMGIDGGVIRTEVEDKVKDRKTGKKRTEIRVEEIKLEDIKSAKIVISLKSKR
jgi:ribosome maturation factor RimP